MNGPCSSPLRTSSSPGNLRPLPCQASPAAWTAPSQLASYVEEAQGSPA